MKDARAAAPYANLILHKRWPEAEPYIIKDPAWALYYSKNVLRKKWPEAEPIIKRNPMYWDRYKRHFNIHEI